MYINNYLGTARSEGIPTMSMTIFASLDAPAPYTPAHGSCVPFPARVQSMENLTRDTSAHL